MVLVHEMVHGTEHAGGKDMTHGPQFYRWRPAVQRAHLELQLNIHDV